MTTPLTPPTFGDKYNVGLTDIGSGYAAGITSAGQSIAGAISSVMGGINQKTGEVEPGILDQKKSSEDYLDMLFHHGMMTQDDYERAKSSSLGAQQKWIGQVSSEFNAKLQAELAQKTALAQVQAQNQGAMARTQYSETQTTGRSQATLQAEMDRLKEELRLKNAANPVVGGYTPVPPAPLATPNAPGPIKLFPPGNQ